MPEADSVALLRALDELAALGTDRDREQITGLKERLDAARLRVLVAGEAKRGKSTLINALLGRVVLPAGVTPLTAVATTVRYGDDPPVTARYAVRRALPGEIGRRRAREHLRREAPDLVAAQIGRARGDLQYRLAEATRELARTVERRFADATGRMRAALRAAEEIGGASAAEAAAKENLLTERITATRHALALLDEVDDDS
jgi:hypothetical protein